MSSQSVNLTRSEVRVSDVIAARVELNLPLRVTVGTVSFSVQERGTINIDGKTRRRWQERGYYRCDAEGKNELPVVLPQISEGLWRVVATGLEAQNAFTLGDPKHTDGRDVPTLRSIFPEREDA